jgi:hypothetical protein
VPSFKIFNRGSLEVGKDISPEGLFQAVAVKSAEALKAVPKASIFVSMRKLLEFLVHCEVEVGSQEMGPEAE